MGDEGHQLNNVAHSMSETFLQELQLKTEGGDQKAPMPRLWRWTTTTLME